MIKTPLSTVIGGAFWTPEATILGGASKTFDQLIKSLFSNGEQGFFYDPNDLTTMWQDQAKLLPVTGEGQPVWHILDKSGNDNHAFATSSATRPILQRNATTGAYYLEFDGSDDFLVTNNIYLTATSDVSTFSGVRKLVDSTPSAIFDFGVGGVSISPNSFSLNCGGGSGTESYTFGSRGNSGVSYAIIPKSTQPSFNAPHSATIVTKSNILSNLSSLRVNNAILRSNSVNQGGGTYGNHPLYIGRRSGTSQPFNGHIYSLIGVGRLTTESETAAIEKELAKRTGVTLS